MINDFVLNINLNELIKVNTWIYGSLVTVYLVAIMFKRDSYYNIPLINILFKRRIRLILILALVVFTVSVICTQKQKVTTFDTFLLMQFVIFVVGVSTIIYLLKFIIVSNDSYKFKKKLKGYINKNPGLIHNLKIEENIEYYEILDELISEEIINEYNKVLDKNKYSMFSFYILMRENFESSKLKYKEYEKMFNYLIKKHNIEEYILLRYILKYNVFNDEVEKYILDLSSNDQERLLVLLDELKLDNATNLKEYYKCILKSKLSLDNRIKYGIKYFDNSKLSFLDADFLLNQLKMETFEEFIKLCKILYSEEILEHNQPLLIEAIKKINGNDLNEKFMLKYIKYILNISIVELVSGEYVSRSEMLLIGDNFYFYNTKGINDIETNLSLNFISKKLVELKNIILNLSETTDGIDLNIMRTLLLEECSFSRTMTLPANIRTLQAKTLEIQRKIDNLLLKENIKFMSKFNINRQPNGVVTNDMSRQITFENINFNELYNNNKTEVLYYLTDLVKELIPIIDSLLDNINKVDPTDVMKEYKDLIRKNQYFNYILFPIWFEYYVAQKNFEEYGKEIIIKLNKILEKYNLPSIYKYMFALIHFKSYKALNLDLYENTKYFLSNYTDEVNQCKEIQVVLNLNKLCVTLEYLVTKEDTNSFLDDCRHYFKTFKDDINDIKEMMTKHEQFFKLGGYSYRKYHEDILSDEERKVRVTHKNIFHIYGLKSFVYLISTYVYHESENDNYKEYKELIDKKIEIKEVTNAED